MLMKGFTARTLDLFVLIVYYGLKDAYLVDCCYLTIDEAVAVVQSVEKKYCLNSGKVIVISLQEDIFIVNIEHISERINVQHVPTTYLSIIAVHSNCNYELLNKDECDRLATELCACARNSLESINAFSCRLEITEALSAPLLAGWLLGYPSVYHSSFRGPPNEAEKPSYMTELCKIAIVVDLSVAVGNISVRLSKLGKDSNVPGPYSSKDVEILGFSIPQSILDSDAEVNRAIQVAAEDQMQRISSLVLPDGAPITVTNVRLHRSTCTFPAIVL